MIFPRYLKAGLLLAVIFIAACSGAEEKRQVYRQSKPIAPLKVPAPLVVPSSDKALMLPIIAPSEQLKPLAEDEEFDPKPPVDLPQEAKSEEPSASDEASQE